MKSPLRILALLFSLVLIMQVSDAQNRLPKLTVSKDHRYLVTEQGRPFFWLGDTGWELFHKLNRQQVSHYLSTRAEQGFTVIQAVALAELDGLRVPNANGDLPLMDADPSKPNELYFKYVEWVIEEADRYGLYIALLPTWGDKVFIDKWGEGPEIFTETTAYSWGKWIGNRFRLHNNVIWVMGGDRNPRNDQDVAVWRSMAKGVEEGVGGSFKALMTFHPQPSESSSSSNWFHHDSWLDFNMLQTGHCRDTKVWDKVLGDYRHKPAKPVVNGEPIYEEHPVCFNAREFGYTNAYDVRKALYLSVFAGALGATYGCHAVWQFYDPSGKGINGPLRSWTESLGLEGASQVRYLRKLMEAYKQRDFIPDQTILVESSDSTNRLQALKGKNYVLVYTAGGLPVKLNKSALPYKQLQTASWYDPRTGNVLTIDNTASTEFVPPTTGQDWVLRLHGN